MRIILKLALIVLCFNAYSQKAFMKYGNIDEDELKMETCSFYEGADAMVIGEIGDLEFNFENDKGWQYVYNVLIRVKVFNKEGKNNGNIKVSLYDPIKGGNREELRALKGVTYNLVNGKIEKTKLNNSEKFETRLNKYYTEVSFTMPNLQNGSVFEYRYEIISDYVNNLKPWYFQGDIPVAKSQFTCILPEFFNYRATFMGSPIQLEDKFDKLDETFLVEWTELNPNGNGESAIQKHSNELNSLSLRRILKAEKIPPVEKEPYMSNKIDIPSRIEFQLITYQLPNQKLNNIAIDYNAFNKSLLKHESFGLRLTNGSFAKDWIESSSGKDGLAKATFIFNKAKRHYVWDGIKGYWSDKSGRSVYSEKGGNVGEINLSLVSAFRAAGFESHPVILSTRGNGTVHPFYPSYTSFNYVVASVVIEGEIYLADATTNLPFGQLPFRCLNGQGWMTSPSGKWIDLQQNNPHKITTMVKSKIEGANIVATYEIKAQTYAALGLWNRFKKSKGDFESDLKGDFEDEEIDEIAFNEKNNKELFKYSYLLEKPIEGEDIIYLQPFLENVFLENPFKRERRSSNIDFVYNLSKKGVAIIEVPEGYTVELPEAVNMKLIDGKMSFKYNVVNNGSTINIISDFRIKKPSYSYKEYQAIKEFFQIMVDKNNQMVVLKK